METVTDTTTAVGPARPWHNRYWWTRSALGMALVVGLFGFVLLVLLFDPNIIGTGNSSKPLDLGQRIDRDVTAGQTFAKDRDAVWATDYRWMVAQYGEQGTDTIVGDLESILSTGPDVAVGTDPDDPDGWANVLCHDAQASYQPIPDLSCRVTVHQ